MDVTSELEPQPRRYRLLVVLSGCLFCHALDLTKVVSALPTLGESFPDVGPRSKWIVEAYLLVYATFLLLGGALTERFGSRRLLLLGLAIFAGGSAAAAGSSSFATLVACRAVVGIGSAAMVPAALSTIKQAFPEVERPRAIAVWTGTFGVGAALGPLLAGFILERWSWPIVMLSNVPLALAISGAVLALVPPPSEKATARLDWPGALLALVAHFSLVYAVLEGPSLGLGSPLLLAAICSAAIFYPLLVLWEGRVPHPLFELSLFRLRPFVSALLVILFAYAAYTGSSFALTQFLQVTLERAPFRAGLDILPLALSLLLGTVLSPNLSQKWGEGRALLASLALAVGGALLLAFASRVPLLLWLVSGQVGLGLGVGAALANASDKVIAAVPRSRAGSAAALNETAFELGAALGVALLGSLQGPLAAGAAEEGEATLRAFVGAALVLGVALLSARLARVSLAARLPSA